MSNIPRILYKMELFHFHSLSEAFAYSLCSTVTLLQLHPSSYSFSPYHISSLFCHWRVDIYICTYFRREARKVCEKCFPLDEKKGKLTRAPFAAIQQSPKILATPRNGSNIFSCCWAARFWLGLCAFFWCFCFRFFFSVFTSCFSSSLSHNAVSKIISFHPKLDLSFD